MTVEGYERRDTHRVQWKIHRNKYKYKAPLEFLSSSPSLSGLKPRVRTNTHTKTLTVDGRDSVEQ